MSGDGDVRAEIQDERTAFFDTVSSGLAKLSVSPALASGAAALWTVGHVRGDDRLKGIGKRIILGLAVAQGIATCVKWGVDRRRPEESNGKEGWRDANEDDQSFPSGHTVNCFITASVISRSTESIPAAALAYALATASAMGRLDRDKHWASDVLAGAVLGYGVGLALTWNGSRRSENADAGIGEATDLPWPATPRPPREAGVTSPNRAHWA